VNNLEAHNNDSNLLSEYLKTSSISDSSISNLLSEEKVNFKIEEIVLKKQLANILSFRFLLTDVTQ
jgi:hypothetical protein